MMNQTELQFSEIPSHIMEELSFHASDDDVLSLLTADGNICSSPCSDFPCSPYSSSPSSPLDYYPGTPESDTNGSMRNLIPLSSGGYIYNYAPVSSPHISPAHFVPINAGPAASSMDNIQRTPLDMPSAPSVACRKEKLEKYRQKRVKRNYVRPVDEARRGRALSQSRDEFGQFLSDSPKNVDQNALLAEMEQVKQQLYISQAQSRILMEKLQAMEQQMNQYKQMAETANASQEAVQKALNEQKLLNQSLIKQNRLLWQTVPHNETFNTIRSEFRYAEPFKEKVDLTGVELNETCSSLLAEALKEDTEFEARWQEMTFVAGQQRS